MLTPGMRPEETVCHIFRSSGFGIMADPKWNPARLKVLLGDRSVTVYFATSGPSEAIGRWQ